jgi:hypothetical protein
MPDIDFGRHRATFSPQVLTLRGLVTYYVLFFIHLESRRIYIAGITVHLNETWMKQVARNATMEDCGALRNCRYLLHDRDIKFLHDRSVPLLHQVELNRSTAGTQPEPECL